MRFKDYLAEARHYEAIDLEKAMELIKTRCTEAYKHFDTPLWRGSRNAYEDALIITGEAGTRKSANTKNYYTEILDHFLPDLGYPKRSKSIILGNNENFDYARSHGYTYAIFPYDGVKIGMVDDHDIWSTIVTIGETRRTIEAWNTHFAVYGLDDSSYQDFKNSIFSVLNDKTNKHHRDVTKIFVAPEKVEGILREAYSPDALNFKLGTTNTVYNDGKARELWIGGKCVAIAFAQWREIDQKGDYAA